MCYTYDSLNRVTARTIKKLSDDSVVSTETFTYDAAGNIVGASENTAFVYDTNNRLTSFNGNSVSYDLDGNMLSNGTLSCTYDSANRLITAGGHTYTYNAEDVRIRNLCSDADTTYVYDTNCKLSKLLCKITNGITTKYVYGRGLIGEQKEYCYKIYHFDCRGSTVAITEIDGLITDTFAYDTYGKCISHVGPSFVIFGYNGRDGVVTDKNGLIYMRARYYSPEMKRFINADIVPGKLSNAITLNRFAYANGNPVSFVDPFGLSSSRGGEQSGSNPLRSIIYDGNEYQIFVPTYSSDDDMEGWEQVHAISYEYDLGKSFNWSNFVIGTVMGADDMDGIATGENPNFSSQFSGIVALFSLATSAATAASKSIEHNSIHFTYIFQEKNGNRRVIITTGTSAQANIMNNSAGRSILATDGCGNMGHVAFVSNCVEPLYEKCTGDTANFFTICNYKITVDKRHKNAKDFYYLWSDSDGNLMMSPIIYENDEVTIGKGYFWYRPMYSFPINATTAVSQDYREVFEDTLDRNGLSMQ